MPAPLTPRHTPARPRPHPIPITPNAAPATSALRHPVPIPARSLPTDLSPDEFGRCVIAYDLNEIFRSLPPADRTPAPWADIIEDLQSAVATDSWRNNGGETSLLLTLGEHLVITTTPDIHRKVLDVLNDLALPDSEPPN